MTRLDELRQMRDFLDREIEREEALVASGCGVIIHTAADLYGVSIDLLLSKSEEVHVVRARHAAAWLMHQRGLSYPQIGRALGRHHTTIMAAVRRIEAQPPVRGLLAGLLREVA